MLQHVEKFSRSTLNMITVPLNTEYGKSISFMFDRVFQELWNSSESEHIEQAIKVL
jgi:hypothetical protein